MKHAWVIENGSPDELRDRDVSELREAWDEAISVLRRWQKGEIGRAEAARLAKARKHMRHRDQWLYAFAGRSDRRTYNAVRTAVG